MQQNDSIVVSFKNPDDTLTRIVYPSLNKFFYNFNHNIIKSKFTKIENVVDYQFDPTRNIGEQQYFYATDISGNWLSTTELISLYHIFKKSQERNAKSYQFRDRRYLSHHGRSHIHTRQEQRNYFIDPDGLEYGFAISGRPKRSRINECRYDNWRSNEKCWKCQSHRPNQWK